MSDTRTAGPAPQADDLLQQAFETWQEIEEHSTEDSTYRMPMTRQELDESELLIEQARQLNPTDTETLKRIAELQNVVDTSRARSFAASRRVIVSALVLLGLVVWMGVDSGGSFWYFVKFGGYFLTGAIAYFIAGMAPRFMVRKRAQRRGQSAVTRALGEVLDGTRKTTHEEDVQHYLIALIAVTIIAALLVWPLAVVNFLRNYVLYT